MAIESGWLAVGSPTGVCNTSVGIEGLLHVDFGLCNQFLQFGNFAHLLEGIYFIFLVSVNSEASGIVSSILQTGEAYEELAVNN
jgi:hypothetical protein